jgi:hypothetical protein
VPDVDGESGGCYRYSMMKMLDTVIRDLLGTDLPIVNDTGTVLPDVAGSTEPRGTPWDRASDICRSAGLYLFVRGRGGRPDSFVVTSPRVYYQEA